MRSRVLWSRAWQEDRSRTAWAGACRGATRPTSSTGWTFRSTPSICWWYPQFARHLPGAVTLDRIEPEDVSTRWRNQVAGFGTPPIAIACRVQ